MASVVEVADADRPKRELRLKLPERLPPLTGWPLRLFVLLWLAALVLAVVAPVGGAYLSYRSFVRGSTASAGIEWRSDGREIQVRRILAEEGDRLRIVPGDAILAVDGDPVPRGLAAVRHVRERLRGPDGSKATIRLRASDGTVRDVALTRTEEHVRKAFAGSGLTPYSRAVIHLGLGLLPIFFIVPAAILIFFRRRSDSIAALLSLSLLLICATFLHGPTFLIEGIGAEWLFELSRAGGWYGLALILFSFPDGRLQPWWSRWAALGLACWVIFAALTDISPRAFRISSILFIAAGALALAGRYRSLPPGPGRQQLRWALFGFASGALVLIAAFVLRLVIDGYSGTEERWRLWGELAVRVSLSLCALSFALGLLVSILRFRLYDAEAVISRSAGYAVLTVLLAATFGAVAKGLEVFFETYFGQDAGALPGVIGAGFAVALITPLNHRIQGWAERQFQKGLVHLRRDLPECVNDLRETAPLGMLVEELLRRVVAGVRASYAAAVIGPSVAGARGIDSASAKEWCQRHAPDSGVAHLDCDRSDPLFPIRLPLRVQYGNGEPVGWLLLGPRPDGSFYGRDEREALAEIADPIARALQIVLVREERAAKHEARLAAVERKLAKALKAIAADPPKRKAATT